MISSGEPLEVTSPHRKEDLKSPTNRLMGKGISRSWQVKISTLRIFYAAFFMQYKRLQKGPRKNPHPLRGGGGTHFKKTVLEKRTIIDNNTVRTYDPDRQNGVRNIIIFTDEDIISSSPIEDI